MSLKSIIGFCARRPIIVVSVWILLMISAGYLSQTYLDSALKGGQGTTKDLEFNLAQKLKDNKMVEFNQISGSDSIETSTASPEEHSDEPSSDNLLIVTSEVYTFPSEQFESTLNSFFTKVQSEIDKSEIEINIGQLPDYDISVSEDGSTILISAPFVSGNLVSPLIH